MRRRARRSVTIVLTLILIVGFMLSMSVACGDNGDVNEVVMSDCGNYMIGAMTIDKINGEFVLTEEEAEVLSANINNNDAFSHEFIRLLNIERARAGSPPVVADARLMTGAAIRANELNVLFSHDRPDGSDPFSAIPAGTEWRGTTGSSEVIAGGHATPQAVLRGWMNSPMHRGILMNPTTTYIGIGAVPRPNSFGLASYSWVGFTINTSQTRQVFPPEHFENQAPPPPPPPPPVVQVVRLTVDFAWYINSSGNPVIVRANLIGARPGSDVRIANGMNIILDDSIFLGSLTIGLTGRDAANYELIPPTLRRTQIDDPNAPPPIVEPPDNGNQTPPPETPTPPPQNQTPPPQNQTPPPQTPTPPVQTPTPPVQTPTPPPQTPTPPPQTPTPPVQTPTPPVQTPTPPVQTPAPPAPPPPPPPPTVDTSPFDITVHRPEGATDSEFNAAIGRAVAAALRERGLPVCANLSYGDISGRNSVLVHVRP